MFAAVPVVSECGLNDAHLPLLPCDAFEHSMDLSALSFSPSLTLTGAPFSPSPTLAPISAILAFPHLSLVSPLHAAAPTFQSTQRGDERQECLQDTFCVTASGSCPVVTPAALSVQPVGLSVSGESGVSVDVGSAAVGGSGRRVVGRLVSCSFCHSTKQRCNAEVPCTRCVRLHRGHLCFKWRDTHETPKTTIGQHPSRQQQQLQPPTLTAVPTHSHNASQDASAGQSSNTSTALPTTTAAPSSNSGSSDDGNITTSSHKRPRSDSPSQSTGRPSSPARRSPAPSPLPFTSTPTSPLVSTSSIAPAAPSPDLFSLLIHAHPCSRDFLSAPSRDASPRAYLSRSILRGLLRALSGGGLVMQPVAQLYVRTRLHSMMSADDAETLVHNHNLRYHVLQLRKRQQDERHKASQAGWPQLGCKWDEPTVVHPSAQCEQQQQQQQQQPAQSQSPVSLSSEPSHPDNRMMVWSKQTFVPAGSYHRDSVSGRCNGSVCGGLCQAAATHFAQDPWLLTFLQSPTEALAEQPYNNQPLLLIQRHPAAAANHLLYLDRLQANLHSSDQRPSQPAAPLELSWSVAVNRAFERLFGYSQRQIRGMFVEHEWLACFMLFERGDWERLVVHDLWAEFGGASHYSGGAYNGDRGWEGQVSCVDRWGRAFDCLLVKSFEMDDQQICQAMHINFIAKRGSCNAHNM